MVGTFKLFQSTHPRGVRHINAPWRTFNMGFQSTHPRGVRRARRRFNPKSLSFNPRTRVGCDLRSVTSITLWMMFQSTHPRGVRHVVYHDVDPSTVVSIHAPAWGATLDYSQRATFFAFQSTHPRGVRLTFVSVVTKARCFNPRTRVGCDESKQLSIRQLNRFNPRTRVGCDVHRVFSSLRSHVSIHAPAWGATNLLSLSVKS